MDELLPKVHNWYEFLSVHKDMLQDEVRLDCYKRALASCVKPGDIVVDIGTGTGILAFLAVQAGAGKVYAIESANVIRLAERVAAANGMNGRIEFIQGRAQHICLPEKVDLLVSEVIGHCALDENMLDAIIDARRRFLKPGGEMIPKSVNMCFAPMEDMETYEYMSFWKGKVAGIDFSAAWKKLTNNIYVDQYESSCFLAPPGRLVSIDLNTVAEIEIKGSIDFRCSRNGQMHGFVSWFEAELAEGVVLDTHPDNPPTHWQSAYFPIETPIVVRAGETIHFECACSSLGESTNWEWCGAVRDRQRSPRASFSQSTAAYWQ